MTTSERLRLIAARVGWFFPLDAVELNMLSSEVRKTEISLDEICEDSQEQDEIAASVKAARAAAVAAGIADGSIVRFPERGRMVMRKVV